MTVKEYAIVGFKIKETELPKSGKNIHQGWMEVGLEVGTKLGRLEVREFHWLSYTILDVYTGAS